MSNFGNSRHEKSEYIAQNSKKIYCEDHNGQKITNFCTMTLKPLCPECIDFHIKINRESGTPIELDTLKNVQNTCIKKVRSAKISLNSELEKLQMLYHQNPEEVLEQGITALKRSKERLLKHVNSYFDSLEETYRKKVSLNIARANDFSAIAEKMKTSMSELDYMEGNVDSNNAIHIIKKICLLDLKDLLEKYRNEMIETMESRRIVPLEVRTNEVQLDSLLELLGQYVEVREVLPNDNQSFSKKSKERDDLFPFTLFTFCFLIFCFCFFVR